MKNQIAIDSYDPLQLLTQKETAKLLSISTKTLEAWRREGKGPPSIKVGGAIRYRRSDLERYIDSRVGV